MLCKCCTQYAIKFGKLSSGHRTGRSQFSFQSQRKAMPKIVETTAQLHSSHTLAKKCSKLSKLGFNSMWTLNFEMFKLVLEKGRTRYQIANIRWIMGKAREFQKNIYFCFIDYVKAFVWITTNWKILKGVHRCVSLSLDFLFCSIDLCFNDCCFVV